MKTNFFKFLAGAFGLIVFSLVLFSFVNKNAESDPWDIPAKYKKMKNPTTPDSETNKIGQQLYKKHCASCHGKKGFGDGKKADELDTAMPDISTDEYKAQLPGVKYYQSFIGRDEMPNFEKKIPDEEDRWFIINYMDTF
jgi:mono/diheme cytochrome c family protein